MQQQPYAPRLQIDPPPFQPVHSSMMASPGAPLFASPASYGALPFGGMVSPGHAPNPGGFIPPPRLQGPYQPAYGGAHAPPMAMQHSLAGSEAPSMMRSSSLSSNGSAPGMPATPSGFGGAAFSPPLHPQHSPRALFSPPLPHNDPYPAPPRFDSHAPMHPHMPGRTKLHASTPSFHPLHAGPAFQAPTRPRHPGRTESISVRPGDFKSPTLSRAPSVSPQPTIYKEEPKKKKLVVRIPRETEVEDVAVDGKGGRPRSSMQRRPLANVERREKEQQMERDQRMVVALEADELVGREQHADEVKMVGMPESLEVFLPGKDAWEDVWDGFVQETTDKFGYCDLRKPSFLPNARPTPFISDRSFPSSPVSSSGISTPNPRSNHGRAASLFSATPSSLPPRLASVLDSMRRPNGHGSSLSLSFTSGLAALRGSALSSPGAISPGSESSSAKSRLTPIARSFTMPSWGADKGGSAAERTPLPASPEPGPEKDEDPLAAAGEALRVNQQQQAPVKSKWMPTLQELGRGFGIVEEDEEEPEAALVVDEEALAAATGADSHLVQEEIKQDRVEQEQAELGVSSERSTKATPSRSASMMSTKTDHTGVASQSSGYGSDSEPEEDVKVEQESEVEVLASEKEVKEADTHPVEDRPGSPSLASPGPLTPADVGELGEARPPTPNVPLPILPSLPAIHIQPEPDAGYDAGDDSDWAEAELSQSEYSNPSDEEDARARAIVRARSSRGLREVALASQPSTVPLHGFKRSEDLDLPYGGGHPSDVASLDGRASSLAVDPDILFEAPSDVDRASDVEKGEHKVTQNFEFPPRSPGNSPVKNREQEKIGPPSSPESLSNILQPDLPPILSFGSRKSSLNVSAPAFTFGAATFGRKGSNASSTSGDDLAFGSFGHPGSLDASPSLPADPSPKSVLTPLNPGAGEFVPSSATFSTFALRQQASVASLDSAMGWGDAGKPGSIAASSPGFALDLPTPPKLDALPEALERSIESQPDSTTAPPPHAAFSFQPPPEAPAFVMPTQQQQDEQPRRSSGRGPLPPIPLTTVTPHAAAVKRQKVESDLAWLPASSSGPESAPMQRMVSAPQLAHPQPRRPLLDPPLAQLQLQQHRRIAALDADQEERDFHAGSEGGNLSLMSVDDPLPEQYAPAHSVLGRRRLHEAGASASRPFSLRAAASFSNDGRVLDFQPVSARKRSPLPSFETPQTSIDASSRDNKKEASPARMGDPRARQESVDMALPNAARPKSKALPIPPQREGTGSDIFDNDEAMPLTPVTGDDRDSVVEFSGDEEIEEDDLPLQILEQIISEQFNSLKAELAMRPHQDQAALVDAFADRVELLLATSGRGTSEPAHLVSLLADAHERTERAILTALDRFALPSSVVLSAPHLAPSEPQLSLSAPVTPMRLSTPAFDGGPAAAYGAFLDDLRATVQPLVRSQVDSEVLVAKLAAVFQPQLAHILSRMPLTGQEASKAVVDELRAVLKTQAASAQVEKAKLAADLAELLAPSLAPIASLSGFADTVTVSLTEHLKRQPNGTTSAAETAELDLVRSTLASLKDGQAGLVEAATRTQDLQTSLKSSMGQLGLDVTSRLDVAYSQLEELFKVHFGKHGGATSEKGAGEGLGDVAELEMQLAKARNDHGKARSEKAVLSDRLDAEKARHAAELDELRRALAKSTDALKAGEVEKAVAAAQAERVAEDLAKLKTRCAELEDKRNTARKSLEEEMSRRQQREQVVGQQERELTRLREEVERLRGTSREAQQQQQTTQQKLEGALSEKEQLVGEKQEVREALAEAKGTILSLEKRLAMQDDRLSNVQRVKALQQQTLAAANQRNTGLAKDAAALKAVTAELSEARHKLEHADAARLEAEQLNKALAAENDAFRQKFAGLQTSLEKMKAAVTREKDEAKSRITDLTAERDRLVEVNSRLEERLLDRQAGANGLDLHFYPASPDLSHYHTPFLRSTPSTPPTPNGRSYPTPPSKELGNLAPLRPQHTGDSAASDETIAHTSFSPTPSVSGQSFVLASDGWYSAA
ncbi:hypothetical protein JCM10207_004821 [Rhodosporidiobolus poonsookiae]